MPTGKGATVSLPVESPVEVASLPVALAPEAWDEEPVLIGYGAEMTPLPVAFDGTAKEAVPSEPGTALTDAPLVAEIIAVITVVTVVSDREVCVVIELVPFKLIVLVIGRGVV